MTPTNPLTRLTGRVVLGTADLGIHSGRDRDADVAMLRAGLDAGAGIIDTARAYAHADNPTFGERIAADAAAGRDGVLVGTKGTHSRVSESQWDVDISPERLRADVDASLRALGTERIDLYYLHRVDLAREAGQPVELGWTELVAMRNAGKVARAGLSNVTVAELETAAAIGAVDAVQNRHTAIAGESGEVIAWCEANDVAFFAYSPLRIPPLTQTPALAAAALSRGLSLQRLLLRGLLASSPVMSVISGATRIPTVLDSVAAETTEWDDELEAAYRADLALNEER
jgi:aryl-alcohol dehydrogenase-like predicted oxidoreductase